MLEHYYRLLSGSKEMNPALAYSGTKNYNTNNTNNTNKYVR